MSGIRAAHRSVRRWPARLHHQAGQVVVLVALLLPLLLIMAAVAIDLGNAYVQSTSIQKAADAAALAAAQQLATPTAGTGTITTLVSSRTVTGNGTKFTTELAVGEQLYKADGTTLLGTIASITSNTSLTLTANAFAAGSSTPYTFNSAGLVAERFSQENLGTDAAVLTNGFSTVCDGKTVTNCYGLLPTTTPTQIKVSIKREVPLIIGGALGLPSFKVEASAAAQSFAIDTGYWVLPLAVNGKACDGTERTTFGSPPCAAKTTIDGKPYDYMYYHQGSCRNDPAGFCWVDFTVAQGVTIDEDAAGVEDSKLLPWITDGYPTPLTVPFEGGRVDGRNYSNGTGDSWCGHAAVPAHCQLIREIQKRQGDLVLVPVFATKNVVTKKDEPYFKFISFAAFRLAEPTTNNPEFPWARNPNDANKWLLVGKYEDTITCEVPPTDGGTRPSDNGAVCYATSSGGNAPSYGVRVISLTG